MNRWRKAVSGLVLGCGLTAAWIVGGTFFKDVQFARAEQKVEASRQQMSNVQDMATVFKAIGRAVSPSVVSIDVRKTIHNPHRGMDENQLRRFFRFRQPGGAAPNPGDDNDQQNDKNGDDDSQTPPNLQMPDAPEEYEQGLGSGVIVEVDGNTAYIVTNNHVAGG